MLSIFKKYPPQNPPKVALIYPLGPFRLILHFAHTLPTQIPTRHMLSIFTKYPPRYPPIVEVGTFKKYPSRTQWVNVEQITSETLDSFHNSHQKVPSGCQRAIFTPSNFDFWQVIDSHAHSFSHGNRFPLLPLVFLPPYDLTIKTNKDKNTKTSFGYSRVVLRQPRQTTSVTIRR